MKTVLHIHKSILITFFLMIAGIIISSNCFAQGDIFPLSQNSFTGGATVCQNATAPNLLFSFNTENCGSTPFSGIDITVTWFASAINTTSGGTPVWQEISTTATTSFNYAAPTNTVGTLYYYVEVSWGTGFVICAPPGTITSNEAQEVTVNAYQPASVSIGASATNICAGTSVTFTATPTNGGASPSYQWQLNGINAGTNNPLFTSSGLANNDIVTVIMTSDVTACTTGSPATSNSITMIVNPVLPVSVTIAASATNICAGTPATFTATPTNGGVSPSYQWKVNGINAGTNNPVFTTAALVNGDIITVVMTSSISTCTTGNPATSNSINMTVNASLPVSVSIGASATTICAGTSVTFTATPTNGGASPSFQWKVNGVNAGTNSPTFTTSTLANGNVVTVLMTSNIAACTSGNPATSNTITMTVNAFQPASVSIGASATTICAGSSVTFTATPANGGTTPSYQWKVNGVNAGTNSPTFTTTTLANGNSVTVVMTSNAACVTGNPATSNSIVMTVNSIPSAVVIAPASATICQGNSQSFSATAGSSNSFTSGTISVNIPDNNATGASNSINVSGIPAGAVITGISTTFNISHNNDGDLIINLKAPNNNVLNFVNRQGTTGNNFISTVVSSTGVTLFSSTVSPFTGTFAADAVLAVGATGNVSNVATFNSLYSTPNGNWVISMRDAAAGTSGTLTSWSMIITWSYPITWTPITDLYTDAGTTIPYTNGQVLGTVYAKPVSSGNIPYTATSTGANGCTNSSIVLLTVNPKPTVSATPASQTLCSGVAITQINITNPNAVPGTTFSWTRTVPGGLTGMPNSGSGSSISGTFTNSTGAPITTTFTITAIAAGCSSTTTATVTVNPIPTVNTTIPSQTVCSASSFTNIVITNPNAVAGTVFNWTRDNTISLTGLGASGSGTPISGTLINNTNVQQTTIFTITPSASGCSGIATTATVIVNPRPTVNATPPTQTICSASPIAQINITNPNLVAGTAFTWTRDNTANLTGIASSGSGAAITGSLTNTTAIQQTTTFTITATAGSCSSTTTADVKVNPGPVVNSVANASYCYNGNGAAVIFGSNVAGATFTWSSTADVGFGLSGTGNIPAFVAINASVTATISVTATANGCTGPVNTFTITVNPLPAVTISADYCIVPGKVRLTANPLPAGTYTYVWSTGATTQVIDIDIAGSYTVTVTNSNGCKATNSISIATELAVNGNFEAGNTGFTTGYLYNASANGLQPEGRYAVNNNPNFNHTNFWGTDHTTATGKFMIVNGLVGPTVWQETVPVIPNTTYYFSAWAISLNNLPPFAQLQFSVNGSTIGVSAVLVAGVNNNASNSNWQRFYGTWSSGALSTATCSIVDLQGALGGNDFGLDDISISTLSPAPFTVTPSVLGGGVSVCTGSTLNLSANLTGGSSPFTFSWTGPAGFTSNLQNPSIPNVTAANSGTYTITSTDFYGCVVSSSRVIAIDVPAAPSSVTATPAVICMGSASNLNGTSSSGTQSDFSGFYATNNWTITNNPALTGGSVNTSGAPTSISITSGDNLTAGNTDFIITNGLIAGNYTFNWSYKSYDIASNDIPQYSINGAAAISLPGFNTSGATLQSGTATIAVPAGQTFTLRMKTVTGTSGSATVIISNFSGPVTGNIVWYTVPSGGSSIGNSVSGANFPVTPVSSGVISYYAESISSIGCVSSTRTQVNITVNQPSVSATSLNASPNIICLGSSVTLTQSGGSIGTGASWKWYSDAGYTTLVGTGIGATASLTVNPLVTTTYYLRAEGTSSPCSANAAGPAGGVTVTVRQPSIAPTTLNASPNPICKGSNTTLTQSGGSLGTGASWKWYSDAAYTTLVGTGIGATASLSVSPLFTTTYYLRIEGTTAPCTANVNGPAAGVTVTVNQPSIAATGLSASPNPICKGSSTSLTQTGGSLGTGASWKWYSDAAYTTLVGTGAGASASLTVSPLVTTTYYLRAEGAIAPCAANVTGPAAGVTVTVNQPSIAATTLNASANPICNGGSSSLTQSGGSLGTGASWKWYSDAAYTTLVGTGAGATASLTVNPLVTTTYYLRAEGTNSPCSANAAGPVAGITITVNQKSGNPASATASSATICSGSNTTLTLSGGGNGANETIVWYTGSCGGTIAGTGNNLTVTPTVTTTYYGRYENGTPCNFVSLCAQVTVTVTTPGTWLGVNNNWNSPANWCGGVPTSSTNVIIPFIGSGIYPKVFALDAMAHDITMAAGTSLTINNRTIRVSGTITNSGGIFDITDGLLELNGTGVSQNISGSLFLGNTIEDLKISNASGVNISGVNDTLKLSGVLKFGTSNATLNTNNNLTLLSSASSTASIGDMTNNGANSGNNIIGNVTVERYVPNHFKAWQFLAVPTNGQTVNAAWQEGNAPLSNSNKPGYGTIITSNVPGAVALGFDVYTPAGPTMKTYDSASNGWTGIASPGIQIANKKGYMLFVRGDRSVTTFNQPPTSTILRTTGKLYTIGADAPPMTNLSAGTFESIGNPYASAIDFNNVTKSGGVQDLFYVWDPKLTTSTYSAWGLGAYQTFLGPGPNYTIVPGGGSYTGNNVMIESGQAFFVHAPFAAGSVSFTESCKVDGSNLVTRPVNAHSKQLRNNFYAIVNNNPVLLDGTLSQFDPAYSNTIDEMDAVKLANSSENLALARDGKKLVAERRAEIQRTDTIFYNLGLLRIQQYQFEFIASDLEEPGLTAFLEDNYLQSSTVISLSDTTRINFNVENIPGSYAADRFRIVFQILVPTPVSITSIAAKRNSDKSIAIDWKVENETNIQLYTIERSEDGHNFNGIITADPIANNGGRATYTKNDLSPLLNDNFYRIKALSLGGQVQYSSIVKVGPIKLTAGITVYPNPVTGKTIQLQFIDQAEGKYALTLLFENGQQQQLSAINVSVGSGTYPVPLPQLLSSGIYHLKIIGPGNNTILKTIHVLTGQ